jgi:hypothetical protein
LFNFTARRSSATFFISSISRRVAATFALCSVRKRSVSSRPKLASSSSAAATDAAISEGRSIQAKVGVELKGVRWS